MRRALAIGACVLALTACANRPAPSAMDRPAVSRADPDRLMACAEVAIFVDRRVDYEPALLDFLDQVRLSGCQYRNFRIDTPRASFRSGFQDGWSQEGALDIVRTYRRGYDLDWKALRYQDDPRIPAGHLKVTFLNAAVGPRLTDSI